MTAPVPEETNAAYEVDETPPGEHHNELPGASDDVETTGDSQEENAETSLDQPSQ